MAADAQALFDELATEIVNSTTAKKSKMFGMPSLTCNGKAFAGLHGEVMVFKLAEPARSEALALDGAKLFDPMGGRPMKEWVQLPVEHAAQWLTFARAALKYVAG